LANFSSAFATKDKKIQFLFKNLIYCPGYCFVTITNEGIVISLFLETVTHESLLIKPTVGQSTGGN